MYSKCGCMDKALKVFRQIPDKNVISWPTIISGLRLNNRSFEALTLFRQMRSSPKPNLVTLVATLSACARVGALMCGKEIHAHALRSRLRFERFLPNALMDMYVRCGRMESACSLFNTHNDKDATSWNIVLTGHARQGQGVLAIELFQRMIDANVNPDEITFVSILCACGRFGMVSEGLNYINSMEEMYSITPYLKHYACLVDLLGRVGRLEEAHEFLEKMLLESDAPVWGALLNACRIHQQVKLGEVAARAVLQKDSQSAGYYVLLSNLYANSGQWDEVARVRKLMRERGLTADPGCSWVEIKGGVHAFLSGDVTHPQIKEINAILDGFYERMETAGFEKHTYSFIDIIEASKAEIFCGHSERLAIAFGLINIVPGMPIRVTKNLYMCGNCHNTVKFISKIVRQEITVGAQTETELKEKKLRVEYALNATKAAVEKGIVVGGGCTLFLTNLRHLTDNNCSKNSGSCRGRDCSWWWLHLIEICSKGWSIVKRALSYPLKLIAKNVGDNVLSSDNFKYDYNAAAGKYEDLMVAGIIDPTKVFKESQMHDDSENYFKLSLVSCKCIGAYMKNKKNQNQASV
ncbi:hypothetical protein GIB67_040389 [Kingdonia uniflora]|uniref:DYW domain-containing protein n=1 Tax=Kingdonia uniflora TaxID=39325 RepID=A0A7J7KXL7_9MAGN|nr:hypothetical protein GIB67_040389 [Kingdonia uniflora]